jgi:HPt (histidine-containing phosphotransfer) domain-containing protein
MNSSEKKIYDLTNLNELCSFDKAVVAQLVQTFITSTPTLFTELKNSLQNASIQEIYDANHQLKSAFALFQVTEGTAIALAIEANTKDTSVNFETIKALTKKLDMLIQQLVSELKNDFNLA